MCESERERVCVCVCVCVCERERERECVCVCVCVNTCTAYITLHTHTLTVTHTRALCLYNKKEPLRNKQLKGNTPILCTVTFIPKGLSGAQMVSKQLHRDKQENNNVNIGK